MAEIPNLFKSFPGLGKAAVALVVINVLEALLFFPAAISHYLVPAALLGSFIGYGILIGDVKRRHGLWLLAISAVIYFALLYGLSSSYTWQFWVMIAAALFANIGLFIIIGDGLSKRFGGGGDDKGSGGGNGGRSSGNDLDDADDAGDDQRE